MRPEIHARPYVQQIKAELAAMNAIEAPTPEPVQLVPDEVPDWGPATPAEVSARLLKGRLAGARAGKHQSGPTPYGYRRDRVYGLVPHADEAVIVRLIFGEYLRLRSLKKLMALLGRAHMRTRRKKDWSRAGLAWILKNGVYVGRVRFREVIAKGRHKALVSPIVFNKANALLRKNDKRARTREVAP